MDTLAKQIATPEPETHTCCAWCHEPTSQVGAPGDTLTYCENCELIEPETVEREVDSE